MTPFIGKKSLTTKSISDVLFGELALDVSRIDTRTVVADEMAGLMTFDTVNGLIEVDSVVVAVGAADQRSVDSSVFRIRTAKTLLYAKEKCQMFT